MLATQTHLAAEAEDDAHHGRRRAGRGVDGQGRDPRHHRPHRRRRRAPGTRIEYAGPAIRAHVDGRAHDRLQHVDRGGRARRHGRARRDDVRVSRGPPVRAAGRALGRARSRTGRRCRPTRTRASTARSRSTRSDVAPTVTWGTSPRTRSPITGVVPDPAAVGDAARRASMERALAYMGLDARHAARRRSRIDRVFIGSCTNSRLEDLRAAAAGRARAAVAPRCPRWWSRARARSSARPRPRGSTASSARRASSGASPGCSMCVGMNGDIVPAGERCASTSNRNFEGRQGPGARTHLMSPAMAAAAAVTGATHRRAHARPLEAGRTAWSPSTASPRVAAPLDLPNIDTDRDHPRALPAEPRSAGYGQSSSTTCASTRTAPRSPISC